METVTVTLRVPAAEQFTWAHAISADGASYRAHVATQNGEVHISADQHGTATMLVVGSGPEPALANDDHARRTQVRAALLATPSPAPALTERPRTAPAGRVRLRLTGTHVAAAGPVTVLSRRHERGPHRRAREPRGLRLDSRKHRSSCLPASHWSPPDDGTWFIPERIEVLVPRPKAVLSDWRRGNRVWRLRPIQRHPDCACHWLGAWRTCRPQRLDGTPAIHSPKDTGKNVTAARGTWIPGVTGDTPRDGYRCEVLSGTAFHWPAPASADPRVLEHPQESAAQPTCWFANDDLNLRVVPPDTQPYRLTIYVLDYDRNGRALKVTLGDEFASLSTADVSADGHGGRRLSHLDGERYGERRIEKDGGLQRRAFRRVCRSRERSDK